MCMALTIALDRPSVMGDRKVITGTITFDSSYPTGGEDLTPGNLGLVTIDVLIPEAAFDATNVLSVTPRFKVATNKLFALWVDNNGASDSGLIQVPDTQDLSLYGFRFIAFGH